ncbi:MAG: hypothetical protein QXF80_04080 [Thermoplasmatales archaeon]
MEGIGSQVQCKVCGKNGYLFVYCSRSEDGRRHCFERFKHENGLNHDVEVPEHSVSAFDIFESIVSERMTQGEFTFTEIKNMFNEVYGSGASDSLISRNINKAVKFGLIYRRNEGNRILYRLEKERPEVSKFVERNHFSATLLDDRAEITNLLVFRNNSNDIVRSILAVIPYGPIDFLNTLDLRIFGRFGLIDGNSVVSGYSYPGQTGISVNLPNPLKRYDEDFILLNYTVRNVGNAIKIVSMYDTEEIKITVRSKANVSARKWLLDGVKTVEPDVRHAFPLTDGLKDVNFIFRDVKKGETVVIDICTSSEK